MWAQFLFSIFKVCFFDMSKFNSFHTNGSDQAPRGPEPSAARLGPRAFRVGAVDSLGESFVWNFDINGC
jgi:hypothetical protein